MSAIPYDSQPQDSDAGQQGFAMPGRPRRRFFNRKSAALAAAITCAAGFYGGVRVEKGQLTSSTSAAAAAPSGAGTGAAATGATGAAAGAGPRPGFGGGGFGGGGAGGGGGGGGANASFGRVTSVDGNTVYLTDSSGNTVKVKLSSSTKITKSVAVAKTSVHPGDAVVIQGLKNSGGTLVATSLSDSGAATAGSASSASNSGSTNSTASSGTSSGSGN
jgi:hypothetical protein